MIERSGERVEEQCGSSIPQQTVCDCTAEERGGGKDQTPQGHRGARSIGSCGYRWLLSDSKSPLPVTTGIPHLNLQQEAVPKTPY